MQENSYDKNNNRLTQNLRLEQAVITPRMYIALQIKTLKSRIRIQKTVVLLTMKKDNLIQVKSGNGTVANQQFDDSNQVTKILNTKSDGTIISSYSYSYDSNGNRSGIVTNSVSLSYQYHALNQLTQETLPDGSTISYVYDYSRKQENKYGY